MRAQRNAVTADYAAVVEIREDDPPPRLTVAARQVSAAAYREGRLVEKSEAEIGLVPIETPTANVEQARGDQLEVVQRLDHRNAVTGGNDHGCDGKLRIQLVGMDDVGAELAHKALHRGCRLPVPESIRQHAGLLDHSEAVARAVGHTGRDERPFVLDVLVAARR